MLDSYSPREAGTGTYLISIYDFLNVNYFAIIRITFNVHNCFINGPLNSDTLDYTMSLTPGVPDLKTNTSFINVTCNKTLA
jgi:hypothetical protein